MYQRAISLLSALLSAFLAAIALLAVTACAAPEAEPPPADTADTEQATSTPASVTPSVTPSVQPLERRPAPADLPVDRLLQVAFLVVDGVYNSELMAPYDVFQHTIFHADPYPGMETFTVSPDGGEIVTFEGLRLVPHHSFGSAPPIDVLVVPSAENSMGSDLEDEAMISWVREVGSQARFVISLCDGAFVLAQAGLLDGRAATTFPSDQDRFAEMFPAVDLRRGVSYVHDGPAITSEGGARSYDPAMYLVDHLYGEKAAQGVGRGLLIPWPPAGTESP